MIKATTAASKIVADEHRGDDGQADQLVHVEFLVQKSPDGTENDRPSQDGHGRKQRQVRRDGVAVSAEQITSRDQQSPGENPVKLAHAQ